MSWTGSENQRREQGTCSAPAPHLATYRVRASSPCECRRVAKISNGCGPWRPWTTTHTNKFHGYEQRDGRYFIFRYGDYELRIHEQYVDKP